MGDGKQGADRFFGRFFCGAVRLPAIVAQEECIGQLFETFSTPVNGK
jgi:hypothetical protein